METDANNNRGTETPNALAEDVEILKDDVRDLGEGFRRVGSDVTTMVRDAVQEGKRTSSQAVGQAGERFGELRTAAANTLESVRGDICAYVEAKPIGSIVSAFFAGMVFGKLFRRS